MAAQLDDALVGRAVQASAARHGRGIDSRSQEAKWKLGHSERTAASSTRHVHTHSGGFISHCPPNASACPFRTSSAAVNLPPNQKQPGRIGVVVIHLGGHTTALANLTSRGHSIRPTLLLVCLCVEGSLLGALLLLRRHHGIPPACLSLPQTAGLFIWLVYLRRTTRL
jgi:hypothetical protein